MNIHNQDFTYLYYDFTWPYKNSGINSQCLCWMPDIKLLLGGIMEPSILDLAKSAILDSLILAILKPLFLEES